jgi:hypothetical protein
MSLSITINDPASLSPESLEKIIALVRQAAAIKSNFPGYAAAPQPPLAAEDNPGAGLGADDAQQAFAGVAVVDTGAAQQAFAGSVLGNGQSPIANGAAVAAAPAHGTALAPASSGTIELDSAGFPWSADIHASTKTKNADGRWKYKKNVDDATKKQRVEAQLRASLGNGQSAGIAPPATPAAPQVSQSTLPPPPTHTPAASSSLTLPAASPSASAAASPAIAAPASSPASGTNSITAQTFVELVGQVTTQVNAGKLTQDDLAGACATFGLAQLPVLAGRPDLLPQFVGYLNSILLMRG